MIIDDYAGRRQIELGQSLDTKVPIYLDMNFWIIVRRGLDEARKDAPEARLLRSLRDAVASGTIFCPISDTVFLELLKQGDATSRRATTQLIDELSLGVTLVPSEIRANTELVRFIRSFD